MKLRFLKEATVIIALTVVSGILCSLILPNGLNIIYKAIEIPDNRIIDIQTLKQLMLGKKTTLIDVRPVSEYDQGHIPDALNLPLRSPRNVKIGFIKKFPTDRIFILYCSNTSCNQAERLSGEINLMGYENTLIYEQGFEGWQESGNAVNKSIQLENDLK